MSKGITGGHASKMTSLLRTWSNECSTA